ncbi:hypothetical protein [Mastigocoleus testarum]|uniref:Uncharacterized protein n=1 Tax=Mastigocoleus testarum BC008 TaxID=371196 RepID=A0A0V8A0J0_9CYAN|nr:hypothetical protein [Mastigocoleus testarum]KST70143.1 hypothetical protein BC008_06840 [Mastigocoleus testarum BC008]
MTYSNNQDLYFIKANKLLGINPNFSESNNLSKAVIPNFIMTQLAVFLQENDSTNRGITEQGRDAGVPDKSSFSLKDVFQGLLVTAIAFTEIERKHALEMIAVSFQKVKESLLNSKMYDLAHLMDLAIEKIQLASHKESIQEQDLFLAEVLDVINEMEFNLDDEISSNNNLEIVNMSYEDLRLNMSRFAAKEISPNDL